MNKEHIRVKRRERDADHCKNAVANPGRRVPESQSLAALDQRQATATPLNVHQPNH